MNQSERIVEAFLKAPDNTLSMGYIKRELYISEGNARMSELRKQGYIFEPAGKDEYGYYKHKLVWKT